MAVVNEGPQRIVRLARRRRHALDDRLEHLLDANRRSCRWRAARRRLDAEGLLHLGHDGVGPGDRQIDLVEHRHDGQVVLHRQIRIGDRLGLHALKRIDQQDDALAGGEAARDLVAEIDVAGRVDQVQLVVDALANVVIDGDGMHADGDAAFAFEVHGVEELGLELAMRDGAGLEQELVGQGALAVIDVGDDGEIAD